MQEKKPSSKKKDENFNNYVKYSSIAFQMLLIILIGVFGGMKLDKYFNWDFPAFTVVLSVLSVVFSVYYAIKDIIKLK
ncbi:MAG: ATPase F0F1 [Bacteroidetes bacterium]|nr:MAG: ATPase F0F1 [Bacteroidota bacterium]